jgi:hypothetical protein
MRKLVCFALLCVGMSAMAQLSNVTGTVTDTDNQTWNNGTFQITFVPPTGYTGSVYTFNGSAWTPTVHNGLCRVAVCSHIQHLNGMITSFRQTRIGSSPFARMHPFPVHLGR